MTNSFSSALWFWRGEVKNRIGYADHCRSWLLDYAIPFPEKSKSQHLVITYKMLLEPLGIPVSKTAPRLYLTPEEQQAAKEKIAQEGVQPEDLIIGINPGAAYGSAKCWLPDRFKQLTRELLAYPRLKSSILAIKSGAPLVEEICKGLPQDRVINFAGKDLSERIVGPDSNMLPVPDQRQRAHACSLRLGNPLDRFVWIHKRYRDRPL